MKNTIFDFQNYIKHVVAEYQTNFVKNSASKMTSKTSTANHSDFANEIKTLDKAVKFIISATNSLNQINYI